ncbi:MAG: TetR family transcriptional regulator, partial [Acidobacteriota bacterium]
MPATDFQRARAPEQIEQRRQALLQAARTHLEDGGLEAVSLTAIARTAGLAKSNVYRYFESREHILIELLLADEFAWVADLERSLAPLSGCGDPDQVAATVTETLLRHDTACLLISVVANVLEHNI